MGRLGLAASGKATRLRIHRRVATSRDRDRSRGGSWHVGDRNASSNTGCAAICGRIRCFSVCGGSAHGAISSASGRPHVGINIGTGPRLLPEIRHSSACHSARRQLCNCKRIADEADGRTQGPTAGVRVGSRLQPLSHNEDVRGTCGTDRVSGIRRSDMDRGHCGAWLKNVVKHGDLSTPPVADDLAVSAQHGRLAGRCGRHPCPCSCFSEITRHSTFEGFPQAVVRCTSRCSRRGGTPAPLWSSQQRPSGALDPRDRARQFESNY